jgi:hypothetical protein
MTGSGLSYGLARDSGSCTKRCITHERRSDRLSDVRYIERCESNRLSGQLLSRETLPLVCYLRATLDNGDALSRYHTTSRTGARCGSTL